MDDEYSKFVRRMNPPRYFSKFSGIFISLLKFCPFGFLGFVLSSFFEMSVGSMLYHCIVLWSVICSVLASFSKFLEL